MSLKKETLDNKQWIEVYGARSHNLRNIDARLPRRSLTVITGLSGSGKSSLAFDTLYAEGQRRYIETFSAYARNFLDNLERPDVDKITGLSPVISIEQKTTNKNPRSTVGTVTEIYDFLRLLYARASEAYSYLSGEKMERYTGEQVLRLIMERYNGKKAFLLAPVVRSRKGHYKELFESIRRKGFLSVRTDGEIREIISGMKLDRYKNHDIEIVVDKLLVQPKDEDRIKKSVAECLRQGDGLMMVLDAQTGDARYYSKRLMDPATGLSYREPAPNNFSFNSAQGACPKCKGLGYISVMDMDKVIPDKELSIRQGAIEPLGKYSRSLIFYVIETILAEYGCTLNDKAKDIPPEAIAEILDGRAGKIHISAKKAHTMDDLHVDYEGLARYLLYAGGASGSAQASRRVEQFLRMEKCPDCQGRRLNQEALSYKIDGKNIAELSEMDLKDLSAWLEGLEERQDGRHAKISHEILKELRSRIHFLLDVGLDYLSLSRSSMSLSGGESQRIRLATQIGSQLVNVLYILDEPSIGLHQRDNVRLIQSLEKLRDLGNTVVVVEHDKDMMLSADYIIDMGPRAGRLGGEVVFSGVPEEMLRSKTLTADFLQGRKQIPLPEKRRKGNGKELKIKGATGNNLKNVTVSFPLGVFICVTGVSGSGKSTLVNDTLYPILSQKIYHSLQSPLPFKKVEGLECVDKIVCVDQSPIGRTPRSNPATYTGVFTDIRDLFAGLPEAKMRGYKIGRFSFNVKGGRCETCKGNGYKTIEMNFLPDVYVPCEDCHGKRYNRETLEVRFKGKSIADVLDLTISQAVVFFENVPSILHKIKTMEEVGLGYLKLGQSSTTLSGGESQRVKLAAELSKKDTGQTVYILDEPTTGLHFEDVRVLLKVLDKLVEKGNTVIVIEHNLDVIKVADYIIDMGPEGGRRGGEVVATGTPEAVARQNKGCTAPFLKAELEAAKASKSDKS